MFKITERPEFTHDVTAFTPVDGGHREDTFKARFRVIPSDEAETYDLRDAAQVVEFLKLSIVSLEDVVGDDDKPLTYNHAIRDQMLGLYYVRTALLTTYIAAVSKAKRGN